MNRAFELAAAQVAAGKSFQQISDEIRYSRTAVSLYVRGIYHADPAQLEAAILKAYDRRDCPHNGETVDPAVCAMKSSGPRPFGGTARQAWWDCCQRCPHAPETGEKP